MAGRLDDGVEFSALSCKLYAVVLLAWHVLSSHFFHHCWTAGIISLSLFIQAWLNLVKRIEAYDWYMELFIIPCWMRPISYKPSPERRKGMLAFTGRLSYTPSHRSDSSPELQVQVNNLINVSSCLANILCKVKNSPMCEYHILFESNRSLSL